MSSEGQHISMALQDQCGWGLWNAERGVEVGFRCEYCGKDLLSSVDAYDSWQMDHIIPLSRNGEDAYTNIAICCVTCNFMKRAYVPDGATREERVADAGRYVTERRERKLAEVNRIRAIAGMAPLPHSGG